MNRNIVEAQQIIYTAITTTASKYGQKILANAAFHLGSQVWEGVESAQDELCPHSLIGSQRTWQKLNVQLGVEVWGYAYENGSFTR